MKLSWTTARAWMRPGLWFTVLVGCEFLIQWHGWRFWLARFDPHVGWAVPVVLAILAAALWWNTAQAQRTWRAWAWGFVAFLASAVLLSGPILQVGEPLIERLQSADARKERLRAVEQDLATNRTDVKRYQDLREAGAIGYYDLLQKASAKVDKAQEDRRALLNQAATPLWQTVVWIALLVAALVFLQAGAALMAMWCARDWPSQVKAEALKPTPLPTNGGNQAPPPARSTITVIDVDDLQVRRLQHVIKAAFDGAGLSMTAWGEQQVPPIHKRDLSNLFSYYTQKNQGKRPEISKVKLGELVARFLPSEAVNGG